MESSGPVMGMSITRRGVEPAADGGKGPRERRLSSRRPLGSRALGGGRESASPPGAVCESTIVVGSSSPATREAAGRLSAPPGQNAAGRLGSPWAVDFDASGADSRVAPRGGGPKEFPLPSAGEPGPRAAGIVGQLPLRPGVDPGWPPQGVRPEALVVRLS